MFPLDMQILVLNERGTVSETTLGDHKVSFDIIERTRERQLRFAMECLNVYRDMLATPDLDERTIQLLNQCIDEELARYREAAGISTLKMMEIDHETTH